MATITLSKLLDLAIGTPEVGSVNFNILYRLLRAMLQKLELKDHETDISDLDRDSFAGSKILAIAAEIEDSHISSPYHQLEKKVAWVLNQLEQLNSLPSTKQLSDQIQEKGDNDNALSYMWQYMQLKKKVDNHEDGIQKLMAMVADMMKQIDNLQISNDHHLKKLGDLDLHQLSNKIDDHESSVYVIKDRLDKLPMPEEISTFVTWNVLENALNGISRTPYSDMHGNFYGYYDQLIKMTPMERRDFIEESVKNSNIHKILPRVEDGFLKMDPNDRSKFIEDSIEKGTIKSLLPQNGSDLLKMNSKEREHFVEDAIKWGTLRLFLPGLKCDFETEQVEDRMKTIEDSINEGVFHKFLPHRMQCLNHMTIGQKKMSIDSAIRGGAVENLLPGVGTVFEQMEPEKREQYVEKAAQVGLIETYQEVTGNEPPPIANIKKDIDRVILQECQTLMFENNGTVETHFAKNISESVEDNMKETEVQQPTPTIESQKQATVPSRPETARTYSRVSTPGAMPSSVSLGPSPDILDVLERLGKLYDEHNKLVNFVRVINKQVTNKAEEKNLNKVEERVKILEGLLNQKLEKHDLEKQNEHLAAIEAEIEAIKNLVDELKMKEPIETKASFPDIMELVENRLSDSNAFSVLMERVGGLENKLDGFQDFLRVKDSAYSSEVLDTLSFLQDSMSEISSDQDISNGNKRRRRVKAETPTKVKQSEDSKYANVEEGSVTYDIISMLADTVENRSDESNNDRLKRLGLILDDQLDVVRDKVGGLGDDLKLMAKAVEVALERIKTAESEIKLRPSSSSSTSSETLDSDTLRLVQQVIHDLQNDMKKLHKTTGDIIIANNEKQRQIDNVLKCSEELHEKKADKEYVLGEFDVKADKRQLESKVSYSLFNKATDEINKTIREVEAKLDGNDTEMNNVFQQLSEDVDGKIDKLEMEPLKSWIEGRLKELNKKIAKTQPGWSDDEAAGLRKQLIQRFNCLSCDRTVNIMPKIPVASLPLQTSMSNTRSPRPYTIFELSQIRQRASKGIINQNIMNFERALMERQLARIRKSDLRAFLVHYSSELEALGLKKNVALAGSQETSDFYARTRACGGLHTMTFPHRRVIRMTNLNKATPEEDPNPPEPQPYRLCGEESDVQGADGVIYRGRCGHTDQCHGPKGMKILRKSIPPSTSQLIPAGPQSRPGSARNRTLARPGSARSGSRPVSARPNTVQTIREEDATTVTSESQVTTCNNEQAKE